MDSADNTHFGHCTFRLVTGCVGSNDITYSINIITIQAVVVRGKTVADLNSENPVRLFPDYYTKVLNPGASSYQPNFFMSKRIFFMGAK